MTTAYELLTTEHGVPSGSTVYRLRGWDYGLASDDTRATGVEHISVTLNSAGDYPSFTVPRSSLREIEPTHD